MKKFNIVAAGFVLGASLLVGCDNKQEAQNISQEPNAPIYEDEYTFELYKVELVNEKGEVFAKSLETDGGLYVDNNRINAEAGDVVRGVFDSADGEFIAVELVEGEAK